MAREGQDRSLKDGSSREGKLTAQVGRLARLCAAAKGRTTSVAVATVEE